MKTNLNIKKEVKFKFSKDELNLFYCNLNSVLS